MDADPRDPRAYPRRNFVLASAALAGALWLPCRLHAAQIRTLQGEVRVNGKPARDGTAIAPGDVVETGAGARAVFVAGEDAFSMRQRSRLALESSRAGTVAIAGLRVLSGALLAVFGRGGRRLTTPTATIGIRGTGVYVEAQPEQTYLCTCYGEVELADRAGSQRRRVVSAYHTANMIYTRMAGGKTVDGAGFKNHTDEELIELERLVGRTSPLVERERRLREAADAAREAAPSDPKPATPASAPRSSDPTPLPEAAPYSPGDFDWRLPPPR